MIYSIICLLLLSSYTRIDSIDHQKSDIPQNLYLSLNHRIWQSIIELLFVSSFNKIDINYFESRTRKRRTLPRTVDNRSSQFSISLYSSQEERLSKDL